MGQARFWLTLAAAVVILGVVLTANRWPILSAVGQPPDTVRASLAASLITSRDLDPLEVLILFARGVPVDDAVSASSRIRPNSSTPVEAFLANVDVHATGLYGPWTGPAYVVTAGSAGASFVIVDALDGHLVLSVSQGQPIRVPDEEVD